MISVNSPEFVEAIALFHYSFLPTLMEDKVWISLMVK
jgi:hypothetical protein